MEDSQRVERFVEMDNLSDSSSQATGIQDSSCTCAVEEEADLSLCFAEGASIDHDETASKYTMTRNVWAAFKPPTHLCTTKPMVTARQVDIMRTILTGKALHESKSKKRFKVIE